MRSRWLLCVGALVLACGEPQPAPTPKAQPVVSDPAPPLPKAKSTVEPAPTPEAAVPEVPEPQARKAKAVLDVRFAGDIIFGRYRKDGFDPIVEALPEGELAEDDRALLDGPFAKMKGALSGDVVVANLETPVVESVPERSPSHADYRFGASREMASMLPAAGFDVVSLANNHHNDMREAGHEQSERILRELGVAAMGGTQMEAPALRILSYEEEGWRIAFIAATSKLNMGLRGEPPYVPFVETKELRARLGGADGLVARARADHDLVVVSLHWGEEYTDHPSPRQRKAARALIDAGADVVFGHHPHVIQGIEHYHGGLIAYSMGNFLFENASPVPKQTGVLGARFAKAQAAGERPCLVGADFHPAIMQRRPFHHPAPAQGRGLELVSSRLRELSAALKTKWTLNDDGRMALSGLGLCSDRADSEDESPQAQAHHPEGDDA